MASSPDKSAKDDDAGDREDDEDDTSEDEAAGEKPAAATKAAPAEKAETSGEKADTSDDADDEEEDEEPPPPPPPSKKRAAAAKGQPAPKSDKGRKAASKGGSSRPVVAEPVRAAPAQPVQSGTLGKSLLLFVIVVGGLALGFAFLGREEGGGAAPVPKWKQGQIVDVELTLVPSDNKDLSCASATELEGRHCQFEERGKPWSKGGQSDDAHVLKPYTTTDRMQFLAAGVWDQAAVKGSKLPNTRFSLKCKYKVEGKIPKPFVRWSTDGQWFERNDDWFAGAVSDCAIVP